MAASYYGISFNITGLGLNIYLTQFTYGLIEVPAKLAVYYLLDKIGRRNTEVGSLLLVGLCLAINIVIPKGRGLILPFISIDSILNQNKCSCFSNRLCSVATTVYV